MRLGFLLMMLCTPALLAACASGETAQAGPGAGGAGTTATGHGGGATGHGGSTGSSGSGGSTAGKLDLCVLNAGGPQDPCVTPAQLDFGAVAAGTQLMRRFKVTNDTPSAAQLESVTINSTAFGTVTARYEDDPANPGSLIRIDQALPVNRAPGQALYFDVTFTAGAIGGSLPANDAAVKATVAGAPVPDIHVPMVGSVSGCPAGKAACDGNPNNGCETDLNNDANNCGACGTICALPNAGAACKSGKCAIDMCMSNFANCNSDSTDGCETNLLNTTTHCGACNVNCNKANTNSFCNGGNCNIIGCVPGYADCNLNPADGCEADITTSLQNCGGCNLKCDYANASETCVAGSCVFGSCAQGFADCNANLNDGCETDLGSSVLHCGACNKPCNLAHATASCAVGKCKIASCSTGYQNCDNADANGCEIDTTSDVLNCGTCGHACSFANAGAQCLGGVCVMGACNAGFADCNNSPADGCEINTKTSMSSCGACGAVCAIANASATCTNGTCSLVGCNTGMADCNNNLQDGCETNVNTLSDCGACGKACAFANAGETCNNGTCVFGACDPGFANCNGLPADGCEVDTRTNPNNCATCGHQCSFPNAGASCSSSACVLGACNTGFANCNGLAADGCEVNTQTSLANCGGCNKLCDLPNATESCVNGSCLLGSCNGGFANCNKNDGDGCEVDTRTDLANCGGCGTVCNTPNASPSCTGGTCGIASCNLGFANCDGQLVNGCEVHTDADVNNCGSCGVVCSFQHASASCLGGTCVLGPCNAGFATCDGNSANGCETNTDSNPANCGTCGHACNLPNASSACSSGACTISLCNPGFADCDNNAASGCEVNYLTDNNNCGGCGILCNPAAEHCSAGACVVNFSYQLCAPGHYNLDGDLSNGCEYACTFQSAEDLPDDSFIDANCDGVDGDASQAIFVAKAGNDANPGTSWAPVRTVNGGINLARLTGKSQVYLSEGLYEERVSLASGISLYGGYSAANAWARSDAFVTTIRGVASGGFAAAITGIRIGAPTTIDHLTLETTAPAGAFHANYGLYCRECTAVTVRSSRIEAGPGAPGTAAHPAGGSSFGLFLVSSNGFQLVDNEISSGPGGRGHGDADGGPSYGVYRIDSTSVTVDGNLVLAGRGGASTSRRGKSAPLH